MFDKGGATLHPIAVIVIGDVAELPDFGGMNVPADDPIHVTLGGGVRDRLFKAADIFDRILHPLLQIGGKGPLGQADEATHAVENDVSLQQQLICAFAEEGKTASIQHNHLEKYATEPPQN